MRAVVAFVAWINQQVDHWDVMAHRIIVVQQDDYMAHRIIVVQQDDYMAWYRRIAQLLITNLIRRVKGDGQYETLVRGIQEMHQLGIFL
ncbi:hypothetical protein HAX54_005181 [Datura stramonium]|uniref:Uncharacterized protein n=1 Tax=Datura stramonium TaxID=4076 RepID=A0ABS8T921_DATST|nr:hypothetical protein [Datura stramonium]